MTPRRAATTLLVLLAALVWAPLGASSLGEPALAAGALSSRQPMIVPGSSPSPGAGTAAPAPAVSPAPPATSAPVPASSLVVVAQTVPGGAKPAASSIAAGKSATPGTVRSATPAASSRPRSVSSPSPVSDRPAPGLLGTTGQSGTLPWLVGTLAGLAVAGSLLVLLGRRHASRGRRILAANHVGSRAGQPASDSAAEPDGTLMVERRRSPRGPEEGIERRRSSRLEPADDPILSAMGLGRDAPAAGGARAVRARDRRMKQGLEPHPEDERSA